MINEKDNRRNQSGVKDCINTYRNIKGKFYFQWTDDGGVTLSETKSKISEYKKEFPNHNFISIKQKEGYYRIYRQVNE